MLEDGFGEFSRNAVYVEQASLYSCLCITFFLYLTSSKLKAGGSGAAVQSICQDSINMQAKRRTLRRCGIIGLP